MMAGVMITDTNKIGNTGKTKLDQMTEMTYPGRSDNDGIEFGDEVMQAARALVGDGGE